MSWCGGKAYPAFFFSIFALLIAASIFVFGCVASARDEEPEDITPATTAVSADEYEDIAPGPVPDWMADETVPEDIKPIKSDRKIKTPPPSAKKEAPAVETAAPPAATATDAASLAADAGMSEEQLKALDAMLSGKKAEPEKKPEKKPETDKKGSADKKGGAEPAATVAEKPKKEPPPPEKPPEPAFPPTSKDLPAASRDEEKGRIKITGTTEIKLQNASATGDKYSFLSQNGLLYFNDKLQQKTRLNVKGTLKSGLNVDGSFVDVPYQDQNFYVNVSAKNGYAKLGDVASEFHAGQMAAFQKSLRGLDFRYNFGKINVGGLISRQKSDTERETFYGQNIRGPYVLKSSSILENSETVYVNGRPISKAEYTVDYFLGQLTFTSNMDPTDLIEVTYESKLLVSQKTGSMNGLSVWSDPKNKKYDAGFAYLEESAAQTARDVIFETMVTYDGPEVAAGTAYALGEAKLKKQSEIVSFTDDSGTTLLARDTDYEIDYPLGYITFLRSFTASDTVRVVFSYYNQSYLQYIENEELSGSGLDSYKLQRESIYGGTEVVSLYINYVYQRRLVSGTDYLVNEANNSIDFLNPNARPESAEGRTVEVSYEIVPANQTEGTGSKRTLADLTGRVTVGPAVVRAEYSETKSDISLKTVQVLEERVATVGAASGSEFELKYNSVRNTEEIYFNDTVSPNSRQVQGTDYVIEYDAALDKTYLKFKKTIPVGTTILANYKYTPELASGTDRKGQAGRLTADVRIPRGTLQAEYMRKSYFYAPHTQYNDLETDRTGLQLRLSPLKRLMFGANYLQQKHGADFTSPVTYTTTNWNAQSEYNFGGGRRAAYSFKHVTRTDNLSAHDVNQTQTTHALEGRYPIGKGDVLVFDLHGETTDKTDSTKQTSDYGILKGGFGVAYTPSKSLNLKLSTNSNRVKSTAPESIGEPGDFTVKTLSNVLDATYLPNGVWTIAAQFDTQGVNDSRESVGGTRYDKMAASAIARLQGAFRMFSLDFNKQSTPNPYYNDSLTESSTARGEYEISRNWLLTPSFTYSKSSVVDTSRSLSRNTGVRAQYRPGALKGWNGSVQMNHNQRTSATPDSTGVWNSSNTNQDRIGIDTAYVPSGRMTWKNSLSTTKERIGDSSVNRNSITSAVNYKYSPSTTLGFTFNNETTSDNSPGKTLFLLESNTKLDQHFSLGTSLKKEQQSGGSKYNGTLFNMTLNAEF